MAKIKVDGHIKQLVRVDNGPFKDPYPGETQGDIVRADQLIGATLTDIRMEDGEIVFDFFGRLQ